MLDSLHIKNYALLRDITINFKEGFNVLTGETGAGKSILAGALALVFGGKNDTSVISDDAQECSVTAVLTIDQNNQEVFSWLENKSITYEDSLIIRRVLKRTGKGSIYINDVITTRGELVELAELLIDIHSQHESITLLKSSTQRVLLDRYANIEEKVLQLGTLFSQLNDLKKEYDELLNSEKNRNQEIEFLKYSIDEIEKAKLKVGEKEQIEEEISIASQAEKMYEVLDSFLSNVSENREGALKLLRGGLSSLQKASSIDSTLQPYCDRLSSAFYEIEDLCDGVDSYYNKFNFNIEDLDSLNARLFLIKKIESKYGKSVENVLSYYESSKLKLVSLENFDDKKKTLEGQIKDREQELFKLAIEISKKRKDVALSLEKKIEQKLRPLGMKNGVFKINLEMKYNSDNKPLCSQTGFDVVSFMLAANQGEQLKLLQSAASGGELSRVLLAVKSVFAIEDDVETLVFDEIDSGIGGEVALTVAERLNELASSKQILCITHLASIAATASTHLLIKKDVIDGKTSTLVCELDEESRIKEIARMLAGDSTKETSLNHAKELLGIKE